jgi:hypothetical protein
MKKILAAMFAAALVVTLTIGCAEEKKPTPTPAKDAPAKDAPAKDAPAKEAPAKEAAPEK